MSEQQAPMVTYNNGDDFDGATFSRQCPSCGRFIKPDESVTLDWEGQPKKNEPNATCKKCGRVEMDFCGYY